MRKTTLALLLALGLAGPLTAQQQAALTNDDVIGLVKAGLGASVIKAKIASSPSRFDTSPKALQRLKAAKVPDEVVLAMIEASARADAPAATPTPPTERKKDELMTHFQRLQNAVVTVWSETGHGTGFIVDARGLIVTNQHVIGASNYIAVQFDEERKVAAYWLEADPQKDVAVLWADVQAFPAAIVAEIAKSQPPVEEGERVFTIGSPLSQRKILTTGIASKVEERAILSDININPGNSGGPLFNSLGEVVGITTFAESAGRGPGVSGVVRIEEALPLIESARAQTQNKRPPEATLLPVEPKEPFPVEAIKAASENPQFDMKPYAFGAGNFEVAILTPIVLHRAEPEEQQAVKSKEKRTKKRDESFGPAQNLYNWAEYAGQYKAVVHVRAQPKLRETFWSALSRGLAAAGNTAPGAATLRFKTDFDSMELYCGDTLVTPIHPSKIAHVVSVKNAAVNATDATYEGLYTYPLEAFAPSCGRVTLKIFAEKKKSDPTLKVLEPKTLERVWADFEPWRERARR